MKKDIENRADIELLVTTFYDVVVTDPVIGKIFTDIAAVNWEAHLPVMFDFWENMLFYTGKYNGNPMKVHQALNKRIHLEKAHFDQWIAIFTSVVDTLFDGEKAILAKQRAISISTIIQLRLLQDQSGSRL
ncbi:MAG: group III truncated hemoglobin [Chitinophagaceae bacterium]